MNYYMIPVLDIQYYEHATYYHANFGLLMMVMGCVFTTAVLLRKRK